MQKRFIRFTLIVLSLFVISTSFGSRFGGDNVANAAGILGEISSNDLRKNDSNFETTTGSLGSLIERRQLMAVVDRIILGLTGITLLIFIINQILIYKKPERFFTIKDFFKILGLFILIIIAGFIVVVIANMILIGSSM